MNENRNQDRQNRENRENRNNQDQKDQIDNVEFADEFLDLNPKQDNYEENRNRNDRRRR